MPLRRAPPLELVSGNPASPPPRDFAFTLTCESTDNTSTELRDMKVCAARFDSNNYNVTETSEGLYSLVELPEDIVDHNVKEDSERWSTATEIYSRYRSIINGQIACDLDVSQLESDMTFIQHWFETPLPYGFPDALESSALLATTVIYMQFREGLEVSESVLSFAAEVLHQIAEIPLPPQDYLHVASYNALGANRSAARSLPILLTPNATQLRKRVAKQNVSPTFGFRWLLRSFLLGCRLRTVRACLNLACSFEYEVRLYLARGLDCVWSTPCTGGMRCHHKVAFDLVVATTSGLFFGRLRNYYFQRAVVKMMSRFPKILRFINHDSIHVLCLDAAIRALGPAATSNICVSKKASRLLVALLHTQRHSLLGKARHDLDVRETHSLISARTLLTLAEHGTVDAIFEHIDALADDVKLLGKLLRTLSAAAAETPDRATVAQQIWPEIVGRVLSSRDWQDDSFQSNRDIDFALAALVPNPISEWFYLYLENLNVPINWWDPWTMRLAIEKWIGPASGRPNCVDQLIGFLRVLSIHDQASLGLPWMSKLVLKSPSRIAGSTWYLSDWLKQVKPAESESHLSVWQEIVDALVVAGDSTLVSHSE